jgi:hypothetical protein
MRLSKWAVNAITNVLVRERREVLDTGVVKMEPENGPTDVVHNTQEQVIS